LQVHLVESRNLQIDSRLGDELTNSEASVLGKLLLKYSGIIDELFVKLDAIGARACIEKVLRLMIQA